MTVSTELSVRPLQEGDLQAVVALDEALTGKRKESYWTAAFERLSREPRCIGSGVVGENELEGFLFGEVRAVEFGADECGWILALGVRPEAARQGCASALIRDARKRFRALGVTSLRTMVTRTDVPFLSLFRRHGFVGGPFVQLELDISEEIE